VNVAAIDIGTNSMRLLILDENGGEVFRDSEITALGVGVDSTGAFDEARVQATLDVMARFGAAMDLHSVETRAAVATSATRDATNGAAFADAVADRIAVQPEIITGDREARLAFLGATGGGARGPCVVVDIGGGSTEFIQGDAAPAWSVSVDIGAVRLTDRFLPDRPADPAQMTDATAHVEDLFNGIPPAGDRPVIGVAGTFTTLAAMSLGLESYEPATVDGTVVSLSSLVEIRDRLEGMTVTETAAIPALQPKRAPVILAGAVIAVGALKCLGASSVTVSESDLLDALALEALRSVVS
jgi:exopolyphosphatase/guanosine-5'-triphosphate,3'-diphosphate pyrophosphatase